MENLLTSIYKTLTDDFWYNFRKENPRFKLLVIKSLGYRIYLIKCHPQINATLNQTQQMEGKLPINVALESMLQLIRRMQRLLKDDTNNLGTTC